uniref:Putative glutamate--cysteine ligase 2 n=1 Tax=Thermosporothrix sp. COM3 TaxID=2490863 RepID=A0A455SNC6_9CHLR|nr:putative glutamate--cysteine ligase 2 [Thermosporothrix sp. COM3]
MVDTSLPRTMQNVTTFLQEASCMLSPEHFSFGVEEEYQIIDPLTRDMSSQAEPVIQEAKKILGNDVQFEIHLSQIEIATPICSTLNEAKQHLVRLRKGVIDAASRFDCRIASSGSHPFSHWSRQMITPQERYLALERDFQQIAREQSILGCHIHVGIPNRRIGIQVMNHARIWLASLLAISASSPFWWGTDTGYDSFRSTQWSRWPQSGPPQIFSSLEEYESLLQSLVKTNCITDPTKIYWDMRLSERFPTIEIRVADVCLTINEAIMLAGMARALLHTCYQKVLNNEPFFPARQELLRVAHWRAARYGLDAELVDLETEEAVPAYQLVEKLLARIRPSLELFGDWDAVTRQVEKVLREGNGAKRQRRVYQRNHHLEAVVDYIIEQTAIDIV